MSKTKYLGELSVGEEGKEREIVNGSLIYHFAQLFYGFLLVIQYGMCICATFCLVFSSVSCRWFAETRWWIGGRGSKVHLEYSNSDACEQIEKLDLGPILICSDMYRFQLLKSNRTSSRCSSSLV